MKRTRRKYDKEFKLMAVNLCQTGKAVSQVANELDIKTDLLRRWKREYEKLQESSFSGNGNANLSDLERENLRLKKELREAQLERDILKKAVSIFSKGDIKSTNS